MFSWLNELVVLPHWGLGADDHLNWPEVILETTAIVATWFIVMLFTRRLIRRMVYLEGFLRVCAWCRKVDAEEKWTSIENYFGRGSDVETSHALCPECRQKWKNDIQQRKNNASNENIDR